MDDDQWSQISETEKAQQIAIALKIAVDESIIFMFGHLSLRMYYLFS